MKFFLVTLLFLSSCGGSSDTESISIQSVSDITGVFSIPAIGSGLIKDNVSDITVKGVRKSGNAAEASPNDAFHLGSCTKAMTATLAALMIDEGKLNWKTTMSELFPEMNLHPLYRSMTFETLLVHRGGFPVEEPYLFHEVLSMDPVSGRAFITKNLLERTPEVIPDSSYRYSNFNYIIVGHILERLAEKSWEDLLREKIFTPLKMETCGYGVTSRLNELIPTSIWAHVTVNGVSVPRHFDNPLTFGPSSTVHCSLKDWGKFLLLHLKGFRGEETFLKPSTFAKLYSTHPSGDSSYTYGGWSRLERSWAYGPVLTHNGSNLMNFAVTWIAPNRNAVLMSTTNIGGEKASAATDSAIRLLISKNLP